jgi:YebC/PmpR family DNA-binding regulatory protein
MAGHSHAKTIKYRKGGQDAKRAKIFTKIQREIFIAVKLSGADEKFNPKLRLARQKARLFNMPNDKISDAIKRATDAGMAGKNYEEYYYLVSCSGGIFLLVKTLTDNKNRSASDVRGISARHNASIAESSAIDFMFTNTGFIKYETSKTNFDDLFEAAIELGAKDVISSEIIEETDSDFISHSATEIICEFKDFNTVKTSIEEKFGEARISALEWRPNNEIEASKEQVEKLQNLIDELEELDDVSMIYTNFTSNE